MSKRQKIFTIVLWLAAVISMVGVLALKTFPGQSQAQSQTRLDQLAAQPVLPVMYDAPAFYLTDQDNQPVTSTQLKGHPWIADFVFTTCTSSCPTMSEHMAALQKQLPAGIKLVSFSVDPQHDTPPVMKKYLQGYHADPGRWIMLTSDLPTQTKVVAGMKLSFIPASATDPIQHDSHFVLVDSGNHIRGYYESQDPESFAHLIRDANTLLPQTNTAK